jgi:hypothetical protein
MAVMDAAARHGAYIPSPEAAAEIVRAVLECADDECRVSTQVAPELLAEALPGLRIRVRRQLMCELADRELLPTALPRQVITRSRRAWDSVKVELVVPVRHPLTPS